MARSISWPAAPLLDAVNGSTSYATIASRLRQLRAAAGHPSYAEIARRVRDVRERRGVAPAYRGVARVTIYDCFRDDRRRFDVDLVVDIARALGLDEHDADEWERTCWAVQHRADESRIVSARPMLPDGPVRFVGRADQLELLQSPTSRPVFVVHGMAGCGKSALVCEAARRLLDADVAGRAIFADLRGYTTERPPADSAAMFDAIARAAGADPFRLGEGRRDRRRAYGRVLGDQRVVLVLDDAASAAQVGQLVPDGRAVTTFVTSRRNLAAEIGGVDVALDVLDPADAVAFLEQASGVDVAECDPSVEHLVDAVGCLPLALSVIAARIAARPEWTMADHLSSLVARDGNLRLDDKVRAVLDQSHATLSAPARRTLRLLAALPFDGLDVGDVAAMSGTEHAAAAAALDELAMSSMTVRRSSTLIGLHTLVREHARDRSFDEDRQAERVGSMAAVLDHLVATSHAAADAHLGGAGEARYTTVTVAPSVDAEPAARWLAAEFENLLAASSEECGAVRPSAPIEVSEVLTGYIERRGLHRDGLILHERAVAAARALGDGVGEGLAEMARAQCLLRLSDVERSAECLRRAEHLLAGDWRRVHKVKNTLAVLAYQTGDFDASLQLLREAADATSQGGLVRDSSVAHANIAVVLRRLGDSDGAVEHLGIAHERAVVAGDGEAAATALSSLSDVHMSRGEVEEAPQAVTQAIELCERHELVHLTSYARSNFGVVLVALQRTAEAVEHHVAAIGGARDLGDRVGELSALNNLGDAYLAAEQLDAASDTFAAAHRLAVDLDDTFELGRALSGSGGVARRAGDPDRARAAWIQALALFDEAAPEAAAVRNWLSALDDGD